MTKEKSTKVDSLDFVEKGVEAGYLTNVIAKLKDKDLIL